VLLLTPNQQWTCDNLCFLACLCFLYSGCSELVATCSAQDIRLWNANKGQELLRITVANMICNAVAVMRDGKSIISGLSRDIATYLYILNARTVPARTCVCTYVTVGVASSVANDVTMRMTS